MASVRSAISRRVRQPGRITITAGLGGRTLRLPATCRRGRTWWSTRATITASACRGPTCRCRWARRTPARDATRDRRRQWAAEQVRALVRTRRARHADRTSPAALDAGRRGLPSAQTDLAALATDQSQPAIARASALALLPAYRADGLDAGGARGARGRRPARSRHGDRRARERSRRGARARLGAPGLRDPVRAVRLAAAHALAGRPARVPHGRAAGRLSIGVSPSSWHP